MVGASMEGQRLYTCHHFGSSTWILALLSSIILFGMAGQTMPLEVPAVSRYQTLESGDGSLQTLLNTMSNFDKLAASETFLNDTFKKIDTLQSYVNDVPYFIGTESYEYNKTENDRNESQKVTGKLSSESAENHSFLLTHNERVTVSNNFSLSNKTMGNELVHNANQNSLVSKNASALLYDHRYRSFVLKLEHTANSYIENHDGSTGTNKSVEPKNETNIFIEIYDIINIFSANEQKTIALTINERKSYSEILQSLIPDLDKAGIQSGNESAFVNETQPELYTYPTFELPPLAVNSKFHIYNLTKNGTHNVPSLHTVSNAGTEFFSEISGYPPHQSTQYTNTKHSSSTIPVISHVHPLEIQENIHGSIYQKEVTTSREGRPIVSSDTSEVFQRHRPMKGNSSSSDHGPSEHTTKPTINTMYVVAVGDRPCDGLCCKREHFSGKCRLAVRCAARYLDQSTATSLTCGNTFHMTNLHHPGHSHNGASAVETPWRRNSTTGGVGNQKGHRTRTGDSSRGLHQGKNTDAAGDPGHRDKNIYHTGHHINGTANDRNDTDNTEHHHINGTNNTEPYVNNGTNNTGHRGSNGTNIIELYDINDTNNTEHNDSNGTNNTEPHISTGTNNSNNTNNTELHCINGTNVTEHHDINGTNNIGHHGNNGTKNSDQPDSWDANNTSHQDNSTKFTTSRIYSTINTGYHYDSNNNTSNEKTLNETDVGHSQDRQKNQTGKSDNSYNQSNESRQLNVYQNHIKTNKSKGETENPEEFISNHENGCSNVLHGNANITGHTLNATIKINYPNEVMFVTFFNNSERDLEKHLVNLDDEIIMYNNTTANLNESNELNITNNSFFSHIETLSNEKSSSKLNESEEYFDNYTEKYSEDIDSSEHNDTEISTNTTVYNNNGDLAVINKNDDPGDSESGEFDAYITDDTDMDYDYDEYTTNPEYDYVYPESKPDDGNGGGDSPLVYTDQIWYGGTELRGPFTLTEEERVQLSSPNKWHQFGGEEEAEWLTEDNQRRPHLVLSALRVNQQSNLAPL